MANSLFPTTRRSLLDAVIQLCKNFAAPTALLVVLASSVPLIPQFVGSNECFPIRAAWMALLWCLTCDVWFIIIHHWRDIINWGASCATGFFEVLGAVLDGSAGGIISGIMKLISPLLALFLAVTVAAMGYSWVESALPANARDVFAVFVFVVAIAAIIFFPLRTLLRDLQALMAALR